MKHSDKLHKIQESISKQNILWSIHSSQKLIECGLSSTGVINAILKGEIIEDYETSALIFGYHDNNQPIHVVCLYQEDSDCAFITTVYIPDLEHFKSDLKTRRK